jgi:hypothetical protein
MNSGSVMKKTSHLAFYQQPISFSPKVARTISLDRLQRTSAVSCEQLPSFHHVDTELVISTNILFRQLECCSWVTISGESRAAPQYNAVSIFPFMLLLLFLLFLVSFQISFQTKVIDSVRVLTRAVQSQP